MDQQQNAVFLLSDCADPYGLVHPAVCRILLTKRKAFVKSRHPFTIQLKKGETCNNVITKDLQVGIDPGVKHTGVSVFQEKIISAKDSKYERVVLWTATIHDNRTISKNLEKRKGYRHTRTSRKKKLGIFKRSPPPEFDTLEDETLWHSERNAKPEKWLPPSTRARMDMYARFLLKLNDRFIINHVYVEDVKFTPEAVDNAFKRDTSLSSYKRSYLHTRDNYTCQYCGYDFLKNNFKTKSEIDHTHPKSKGGGSDRSNLILSCHTCNQDKGNMFLKDWVKVCRPGQRKHIEKILSRNSKPKNFRYSTLATSIRKLTPVFLNDCLATGDVDYFKFIGKQHVVTGMVHTSTHPGWNTKLIRENNGLPKDHHFDASCVGYGDVKVIMKTENNQHIDRHRRKNHQKVKVNHCGHPRYKFPKGKLPSRLARGIVCHKKKHYEEKGKYKVLGKNGGVRPIMIWDDESKMLKPELIKPISKKRRKLINGVGLNLWDLVRITFSDGRKILTYLTSVGMDGRIHADGIKRGKNNDLKIEVIQKEDGYVYC